MPHAFLLVALIGSALGFTFAAVSSYDFIAHLDRQVHGLHCSFLPGLGGTEAGESGCHTTMMSPYSSVLRDSVWGGVPITLPAMAVFAFLLFWGILIWQSPRVHDTRATGFFTIASLLPVVASLGMATIAIRELDAFCKLCVGIYVASTMTAVGAFGSYLRAQRTAHEASRPNLSRGALGLAFGLGCLVVLTSAAAYALSAPDFTRFVGSCGKLDKPADPQHALITIGRGSPTVLEVLDPLCPSCRAFEKRFARLELSKRARRELLLFPLDNSCNWMVDRALHPGACAVSEALLCAGDRVQEVLAWAFEEQDTIVAEERAQAGSAGQLARRKFPFLASCLGSSKARAKLNASLRWAVANKLPVLTPQLYADGTRLCDADTDLGLDYMITRLSGVR
ncbi:MAG TPA: vitamin K epoxide reductase family protein [Polyangiales bacterium]|nr:vitamin K epoxide reductase family protein [Polyangiales bacterium]